MSNSEEKTFEQQQSDIELAGLKNQTENNLNKTKGKDVEEAAEGIAKNVEKAQSK